MQFLGSVKLDGSKRATLIKEVAEILKVNGNDYLEFYLDKGEVIVRRVLPKPKNGVMDVNYADFWEWARKREIEISLMDDEEAEAAREDLDNKIDAINEILENIKNVKTQ